MVRLETTRYSTYSVSAGGSPGSNGAPGLPVLPGSWLHFWQSLLKIHDGHCRRVNASLGVSYFDFDDSEDFKQSTSE